VKRLLIIRFSALGDVAMLVPIIQQLAISYPNVQITMLSRQQTASLFNDMPNNVHFIGADLKGRHKGVHGLNLLLQDIHFQQFDTIADMHNVLRSKWLCWRMRIIGKRVATLRKGRWQKWLLTHTTYNKPLIPTTQRYVRVLQRLGFSLSLSCKPLSQPLRKGYGIAPFAAHKGKIYPVDKMEVVVRELAHRGEPIYLFGAGEKEKEILDAWEEKYENVYSLVDKYSMNEEISFMRTLRLMLTMDSANMHLASIAGTRVLSIWGATHPNAGFLGYGQCDNDCIQRADLPCRPCSIYGNRKCKLGDYRCLDIDPYKITDKLICTYGNTH
jgi:ADP-heptose:LPS heptosyltransferase